MVVRQNYLHLAWLLRWCDSPENVNAWLQVCDDEPVKSILGNQKSVELDSDEATVLRNARKRNIGRSRGHEAPPLDPPPSDRVLRALGLAETQDIRHFGTVCRELKLELTSTHYPPRERFLTRTPGWREADCETRARIVEVAKTYVSVDAIASEASKGVSPSSLHVDVLGAMWLLLEREPDWLRARGKSWWKNWCLSRLQNSVGCGLNFWIPPVSILVSGMPTGRSGPEDGSGGVRSVGMRASTCSQRHWW